MTFISKTYFEACFELTCDIFFFVSDINECVESLHNCKHSCVDKSPGFECLCESGYKSVDGGVTCAGKQIKLLLCLANNGLLNVIYVQIYTYLKQF